MDGGAGGGGGGADHAGRADGAGQHAGAAHPGHHAFPPLPHQHGHRQPRRHRPAGGAAQSRWLAHRAAGRRHAAAVQVGLRRHHGAEQRLHQPPPLRQHRQVGV